MATCTQCKKRESAEGKKCCQDCLDLKKKQSKDRAERLRAAGICRCGKSPILPGGTCCEACRVRRIKYTQDRARKKVAEGFCRCGKNKPEPGKKVCQECAKRNRKNALKSYQRNKESGLCTQCGKAERYKGKSRCKTCMERHRENQHLYNYGIGRGVVKKMLAEQGGKCKICSTDISSGYHVDHDHESKEVRGLLCPGCNTFLGKFEKRQEYLDKIQDYVDKKDKDDPK